MSKERGLSKLQKAVITTSAGVFAYSASILPHFNKDVQATVNPNSSSNTPTDGYELKMDAPLPSIQAYNQLVTVSRNPQKSAESQQTQESYPQLLSRSEKYIDGPGNETRPVIDRDTGNIELFHIETEDGKTIIAKKDPDGKAISLVEGKAAQQMSNGKAVYVTPDKKVKLYDAKTESHHLISETGDMPQIYGNEVVYVKDKKIYLHDIGTSQEAPFYTTTDKITIVETPVIYGNRIAWSQYNAEINRWQIEVYDKTTGKSVLPKPLDNIAYNYRGPSLDEDNLIFIRYDFGPIDTYISSQILFLNLKNLPSIDLVNLTAGTDPFDWNRDAVVGKSMFAYVKTPWEKTESTVYVANLPPFGNPQRVTRPSMGSKFYLEKPVIYQNSSNLTESTVPYGGEIVAIGNFGTQGKAVLEGKITTQGTYKLFFPTVHKK